MMSSKQTRGVLRSMKRNSKGQVKRKMLLLRKRESEESGNG
jgi:hypothetical protein